jgi:hypothetical protein
MLRVLSKFDKKVLETIETCIIDGKDSDVCLDDAMKDYNIDYFFRFHRKLYKLVKLIYT